MKRSWEIRNGTLGKAKGKGRGRRLTIKLEDSRAKSHDETADRQTHTQTHKHKKNHMLSQLQMHIFYVQTSFGSKKAQNGP